MDKPVVISVVGPTAVGKTAMAIRLAKEFNAEILSADSRQFYREISIGTAKPTTEELTQAKHHFINNLSIEEDYNASDFEKEALDFLEEYFKTKKIIILCGGSGMYVDALLNGFDNDVPTANKELRKELNVGYEKEGITYLQNKLVELDPDYYEIIDKHNSKRLLRAIEICLLTGKSNLEVKKGIKKERDFSTIKIGLHDDRGILYERINRRVDKMMEEGLLEEVKQVEKFKAKNALNTVGYKELFDFLENKVDLSTAVDKIKVNSRRYAKRQLTWFKKSDGIEWFKAGDFTKISMYIRKILSD